MNDQTAGTHATGPEARSASPARQRLTRALGFRNISAIYIWIVAIVLFSIWLPKTFPHWTTLTVTLNSNAIAGLVALSLLFPLAAGVYDLSVGYTLGFSSVLVAWLLGETGMGWVPAVLITMCAALLIGAINGLVVVVFRINSFIATLATGSLLQAAIIAVTKEQILTTNISRSFEGLSTTKLGDITVPVVYAFVVALLLWFVLEHTVLGRFAHATGLAELPARLAGVRTHRIRFGSLLVSAAIAGFAGILLTANIGSASPTAGPPYLIPAFAAAFLGATQLKAGLFNAWGTIIAVLLLGTINVGLSLANVPLWTPYVVIGVVLIAALGLGGLRRRASPGA